MRTNKGRVQVYRTPTSIEQAKRTECREARAAFSSHPSKFLGHTHYRVSISSVAFINLNGQSFFSFLLCFKIFLISQSSSLHNCLCSHYPPFSLSSFFFFFLFGIFSLAVILFSYFTWTMDCGSLNLQCFGSMLHLLFVSMCFLLFTVQY